MTKRRKANRPGNALTIAPLSHDAPSLPRRRRSALPDPLNPDESHRLRQVMRSLASELRSALSPLPEFRQGPSAISRLLSIDRATAHRVLALATQRAPEGEVLASAPGPEAFEKLLRALARKRSGRQADLASLNFAIEQFRGAVQELGGGSKTRLTRRIAATVPRGPEGDAPTALAVRSRRDLELREQLFSVSSELVARHTDTRIDMMICRLNPQQPDSMDYAQIRGIIGHRSRPLAQPLSVELLGRVTRAPSGSVNPLLSLEGKAIEGAVSATIIRPFSTHPLPVVLSRGVGDRVRHVVDPTLTAEGAAIDVVVGWQRPRACQHPALDEVPALEVGALIREPTRCLILDTWLHRDMAAAAVPSLEAYLWSPTVETSLADHWLDRLPGPTPLLRLLGRGLERCVTASYPRHAELTRHAFQTLRWDPAEFIGYRAEIEYPMWGGAYFAVFDYSK